MKTRLFIALAAAAVCGNISAQVGTPFVHDPATIAKCDGKYYTWGTGGAALVSEDGWVWTSGERIAVGAAPDILQIGDRYMCAYSTTGGGLGGTHGGKIMTMWNKTLDPKSPDYKWSEPQEVAHSEADEDCDAIDAGIFMDPNTGRLWVSYGTYFGNIRIVELDPETGLRKEGNEAVDVAIDCEASDPIYNDGWYYLLGTHGTCCDGTNSTYNIVVGRSKDVQGPYIDNVGRDMFAGGGKLVVGARDGFTGAGHFGRYIVCEGVEKMSMHWEADFSQGGRSTLAILPLIWKNGWPQAGQNVKDGVYEIESERRGYALELATDFVRMGGGMRSFGRGSNEPVKAVEPQKLEDVIAGWPEGDIDVRICDYMFRPNQKWNISIVPDAGGYLGGAYYKICIDGTNRALAAAEGGKIISVPEFTGAAEQLWQIDQLTDGTYRIMPKQVPGTDKQLCLYSAGDCTATLAEFDFSSDNCKWNFRNW